MPNKKILSSSSKINMINPEFLGYIEFTGSHFDIVMNNGNHQSIKDDPENKIYVSNLINSLKMVGVKSFFGFKTFVNPRYVSYIKTDLLNVEQAQVKLMNNILVNIKESGLLLDQLKLGCIRGSSSNDYDHVVDYFIRVNFISEIEKNTNPFGGEFTSIKLFTDKEVIKLDTPYDEIMDQINSMEKAEALLNFL